MGSTIRPQKSIIFTVTKKNKQVTEKIISLKLLTEIIYRNIENELDRIDLVSKK